MEGAPAMISSLKEVKDESSDCLCQATCPKHGDRAYGRTKHDYELEIQNVCKQLADAKETIMNYQEQLMQTNCIIGELKSNLNDLDTKFEQAQFTADRLSSLLVQTKQDFNSGRGAFESKITLLNRQIELQEILLSRSMGNIIDLKFKAGKTNLQFMVFKAEVHMRELAKWINQPNARFTAELRQRYEEFRVFLRKCDTAGLDFELVYGTLRRRLRSCHDIDTSELELHLPTFPVPILEENINRANVVRPHNGFELPAYSEYEAPPAYSEYEAPPAYSEYEAPPAYSRYESPHNNGRQQPPYRDDEQPPYMENHGPSTHINQTNAISGSHAPGTCRNQIPATSRNQIPATSRSHIPATSRNQIPATSRNHIPATSRNRILATSRNRIPATSRNRIPATSRNRIPATSRNQIPATSENQISATSENHAHAINGNLPPSTNGYQNPTTNGYQNPTTNGDQNPTTNGDQNPTTNGDQNPTTNGDQNPTTNGDQNPATNEDQNPTTNGDQNPTTNGDQNPATNEDQNPTTNGDQNPTTNGDQNPTTNGDQNPTTNGYTTPINNSYQIPSTSGQQAPSTIGCHRPPPASSNVPSARSTARLGCLVHTNIWHHESHYSRNSVSIARNGIGLPALALSDSHSTSSDSERHSDSESERHSDSESDRSSGSEPETTSGSESSNPSESDSPPSPASPAPQIPSSHFRHYHNNAQSVSDILRPYIQLIETVLMGVFTLPEPRPQFWILAELDEMEPSARLPRRLRMGNSRFPYGEPRHTSLLHQATSSNQSRIVINVVQQGRIVYRIMTPTVAAVDQLTNPRSSQDDQ